MTSSQATSKKLRELDLIPIPNLDEMKVGHAGLYQGEEEQEVIEEETVTNQSVITADIDIKKMAGLGKVLKVEDGINDFVDALRLDKTNHLPDTITGVWVHYLTKGIEKDFGRTWSKPPVSIKPKPTELEKKYDEGTRVMSKKEKNNLLAQTDWNFYRDWVKDGDMSKEEAMKRMNAAIEKVEEIEQQGFYLSPKKTEGVKLYDIDKEINIGAKTKNGTYLYKSNNIDVIYPNIIQKAQIDGALKKAHYQDIKNSSFSLYTLEEMQNPGMVEDKAGEMKRIFSKLTWNTTHIGRILAKGNKARRWIIFDCIVNKSNNRCLVLYDGSQIVEFYETETDADEVSG